MTTMEAVIRLRDAKDYIESEITVRGQRVQVVNFFRDGRIADHGEMSLDTFSAELDRIVAEKRKAGAVR